MKHLLLATALLLAPTLDQAQAAPWTAFRDKYGLCYLASPDGAMTLEASKEIGLVVELPKDMTDDGVISFDLPPPLYAMPTAIAFVVPDVAGSAYVPSSPESILQGLLYGQWVNVSANGQAFSESLLGVRPALVNFLVCYAER